MTLGTLAVDKMTLDKMTVHKMTIDKMAFIRSKQIVVVHSGPYPYPYLSPGGLM